MWHVTMNDQERHDLVSALAEARETALKLAAEHDLTEESPSLLYAARLHDLLERFARLGGGEDIPA